MADRYEYWGHPTEELRGDSLYVNIRYDHAREIANYKLVVKFAGGFFNTTINNNTLTILDITFKDNRDIEIKRFVSAGLLKISENGRDRTGVSLTGKIPLPISDFDILERVSFTYRLDKE